MNKLITQDLSKTFVTFRKEAGVKGSIKALFKRERVMKEAVKHFDFEVEEGELVGLIGPNGAGKTTLIKMLTGIVHPTSGNVNVFGHTPCELTDEYKKQYAMVMGQKSQLWWDLPAIDSFYLNKEIYSIPDQSFQKNIEFLTGLFEVGNLLHIQVRNLSLGERMKLELILALLHEPKILFLDEPTIGLDACAQKQIRQFLLGINQERKTTILLTSHYMEDIRHLCKRVVVINHGQKIYDGLLNRLLDKYRDEKMITVTFETGTIFNPQFQMVLLEQNPYQVVFKIAKDKVKPALEHILANYEVDDINIVEEDITNLIEKIYGLKGGAEA